MSTSPPTDARLGDLDRKDRASAIAARYAERTHAFRAGRDGACDESLRSHYAQSTRIGSARVATTTDGIGTKVELAERTRIYDTLAFDLVAMVTDDLAAAGATSLSITNVLDVDRIDVDTVEALMRGLESAARAAEVAVTGGEIAELGPRVGGYGEGMHFNWCATAIGTYPEGRAPLTGVAVEPAQVLVGLENPGFRSNGFSLVRRILEARYGATWHDVEVFGSTWGKVALAPSTIYAPLVSDLLDAGVRITGAAHVTGGGIANKLGRVLRATGLGARLDAPLAPTEAVLELQRLGSVDDESAYRAWNMGQGFLLVTEREDVDRVLAAAALRGIGAAPVGHVTKEPVVSVRSRGLHGGDLAWPTPRVTSVAPPTPHDPPTLPSSENRT